ncbi:MAG: hypothetical protein ACLFVP_00690 [Candidatus Bathyarchaeia archaeon]
MPIFEVESWRVAGGKEDEHADSMRRWLRWVKDHRDLFKEWKSLRYFVKEIAGEETERHIVIWEYDSLADFERYKERRGNYEGAYTEYRENDPYHQDVFNHQTMKVEIWRDRERELWIE